MSPFSRPPSIVHSPKKPGRESAFSTTITGPISGGERIRKGCPLSEKGFVFPTLAPPILSLDIPPDPRSRDATYYLVASKKVIMMWSSDDQIIIIYKSNTKNLIDKVKVPGLNLASKWNQRGVANLFASLTGLTSNFDDRNSDE